MTAPHTVREGTPLTPAELRVMRAAAKGLADKQIAASLSRSDSTVADHLDHAFRRLGVQSRIAAFRALGWLQVPE